MSTHNPEADMFFVLGCLFIFFVFIYPALPPQIITVDDEHISGESKHVSGNYYIDCDGDKTIEATININSSTNKVTFNDIAGLCTENIGEFYKDRYHIYSEEVYLNNSDLSTTNT